MSPTQPAAHAAASSLPMAGIRVVELSTMVTASMAALMLCDQGAEVVKVEPPDIGDPMRYLGNAKGGISALFANCNRGKRSLAIDIRTPEGRDVVIDLVARADVLVHNFRPGVMDRLGLGEAVLRARNPQLVHAGVSGFGEEGEYAGAPAYDHIMQAWTGFTGVQGLGGTPEFMRTLVCDKVTAYTLCQAVTAALFRRARTGEPARIDVSMRDASLFFLWPDGMMSHTLLDDDVAQAPPMAASYAPLPTRDGFIIVAAGAERQWQGLMRALGLARLITDPRYATPAGRAQQAAETRALMLEALAGLGTTDALARLAAEDVPAAPCRDIATAIASAEQDPFGPITTHEHPRMGTLRVLGAAARFDGQRLGNAAPCPALGEQTREILAELGRDAATIDACAAAGIIAG